MDCMRETAAMESKEQEELRVLKKLIQKSLDGKWQVVKGKFFTAEIEETIFKYFIEIEMKTWKYMILSKSSSNDPYKRDRM